MRRSDTTINHKRAELFLMKTFRVALALFALALVLGVIVVISSQTDLLVTTRTDYFTTTTTSTVTITSVVNHTTMISIYENVEMTGTCAAVSYFAPDTSVVGQNMTETVGSSTFSTSTYGNHTVGYVMTSTSDNLS